MIFKLGIKNGILDLKKYTAYYLTLVILVALFYTYFSVGDYEFIKIFDYNNFNGTLSLIYRFGFYFAIVIGVYVIYSSNYLLKFRKREFNIYYRLGIGFNNLSLLMFVETMLTGFVVFIAGIFIGVSISSIFGYFIVRLFSIEYLSTPFKISANTIFYSFLFFCLVFILSSVRNSYSLKQMFSKKTKGTIVSFGKQKNNSIFSFIVLLLALALIFISYFIFINVGIDFGNRVVIYAVFLIIIGFILFVGSTTLLFYYALKNKRFLSSNEITLYTKKSLIQNLFRNVLVISLITVLLSISLINLAIGYSYHSYINNDYKLNSPYFTISIKDTGNHNLNTFLSRIVDLNYSIEFSKEISLYYSNLYNSDSNNKYTNSNFRSYSNFSIPVVSVKTYNDLLRATNSNTISLTDTNFTLAVNKNIGYNNISNKLKKDIKVFNNELNFEKKSLCPLVIPDILIQSNYLVIVPEHILKMKQTNNSIYLINTKEYLRAKDLSILSSKLANNNNPYDMITRLGYKQQILANTSYKVISGFFIGIIFLLVSFSILSLHKINEAILNIKDYNIMLQLGVRENTIRKSILKNILYYFGVSLAISLPNFIVGIITMYKWYELNSNISLLPVIGYCLLTAFAVTVFFIVLCYKACINVLSLYKKSYN